MNSLINIIRPGDRVTILDLYGKPHTGRAVMLGPAGWVLNMGGPHGTPLVTDGSNIVRVTKARVKPSGLANWLAGVEAK